MTKKEIRAKFREEVLTRDKNQCKICNKRGHLDVHHICDRNEIPNGGYVKENGIALCPDCHLKAEVFHSTGQIIEGWTPTDLYKIIGSSLQIAVERSKKLR